MIDYIKLTRQQTKRILRNAKACGELQTHQPPGLCRTSGTGRVLRRTRSSDPALVTITTDGSCIGNPGPGGWACVIRSNGSVTEMFGCEPHTTNNRMELQAVIEALNAVKEYSRVVVNVDSE